MPYSTNYENIYEIDSVTNKNLSKIHPATVLCCSENKRGKDILLKFVDYITKNIHIFLKSSKSCSKLLNSDILSILPDLKFCIAIIWNINQHWKMT